MIDRRGRNLKLLVSDVQQIEVPHGSHGVPDHISVYQPGAVLRDGLPLIPLYFPDLVIVFLL